MQLWKPVLALVPAGLLLGLVAGQATRPVMLVKDDRPWPQSVRERVIEAERWPSLFDSGAQGLSARGYSYRPALDYELYAWPDQTDRSAELLAAGYDYGRASAFDYEPEMAQTHRAEAELAGSQAESAAVEVAAADDRAAVPPAPAPRLAADRAAAFVLPPVPPPLARAGEADPVGPAEGEDF